MELPSNDIRVHLGFSPSERALSRRRQMDDIQTARLPYVLFHPRTRVHDYVGIQTMARRSDDQGDYK